MPIQPDDLFLINQTDGLKTIKYSELFSGLDGSPPVTINETAPVDPSAGDLWWADSDVFDGGGRLYLWTGTEWVDVSIIDAHGEYVYTNPEVDRDPVIRVIGGDPGYPGNIIVIQSNAHVKPNTGEAPFTFTNSWYLDDTEQASGDTYEISSSDINKRVRLRQTIEDDRGNTVLSGFSNSILCEAAPADPINFDLNIIDDGTNEANGAGHDLTAVVDNIIGGINPINIEHQWYSNDSPVGDDSSVYSLQNSDVGNTIKCTVIVAEDDNSADKIKTATYSKTIVDGASIVQPSILSPENGAGLGDDTTTFTKTSEITNVVETDGQDGETWSYSDVSTNGGIDRTIRYVTSIGPRSVTVDRTTGLHWYNDTDDLNTGWQKATSNLAQDGGSGIVLQGGGVIVSMSKNGANFVSTDGDSWAQFNTNIPNSNVQSGLYSTNENCFYVVDFTTPRSVFKSRGVDYTTWGQGGSDRCKRIHYL